MSAPRGVAASRRMAGYRVMASLPSIDTTSFHSGALTTQHVGHAVHGARVVLNELDCTVREIHYG